MRVVQTALPAAVALGLLGAAAPALAQFSLEPDWASRPDQDALADRYPQLPLLLEIEGRALVACDVTATGGLKSCVVHEEAPQGFGFGAAALRMTSTFRMRPGIDVSRNAPHGTVRIPIRFVLPPVPPAPDTPPLSPAAQALAARLAAAADPLRAAAEQFDAKAGELERAQAPGTTAEARAAAAAALRIAYATHLPQGRRIIAEAVARRMDEAELAAVIAFVETPLGKRWFGGDPAFQAAMRKSVDESSRRLRADTRAIFCKAADCAAAADEGLKPRFGRPAPGEPPPDPDAPLPDAPWELRPNLTETLQAWPLSYMFGIAGHARAICVVGALGGPEECEVVFETPRGLGVGPALLTLADRYRVAPAFLAGGVGRRVFLYASFPASGAPVVAPDPPTTATPARLNLAQRLASVQDAEREALDEDPNFVKALARLNTLPPGVRAAAEAAMREASEKSRTDNARTRARILAETFGEADLQALIRFEEGPSRGLRRALRDSQEELRVLGLHWSKALTAEARASFCKTHDCAAPPPATGS